MGSIVRWPSRREESGGSEYSQCRSQGKLISSRGARSSQLADPPARRDLHALLEASLGLRLSTGFVDGGGEDPDGEVANRMASRDGVTRAPAGCENDGNCSEQGELGRHDPFPETSFPTTYTDQYVRPVSGPT